MSISHAIITQAITQQVYAESLDDFADLLQEKRNRVNHLTENMTEANFKQLKAANRELKILEHVANYLVVMDDAIRSEYDNTEKDWLRLQTELEKEKNNAADNWRLFTAAANSEYILSKIIIKNIQPAQI